MQRPEIQNNEQHQHNQQGRQDSPALRSWPVGYLRENKVHAGTCGNCIHSILGQYVDVQWNIKRGCMVLKSAEFTHKVQQQAQKQQSDKHSIKYSIDHKQGIETIKNVPFFHGNACPLLNQIIVKNPEKPMKPCACVMLYNRKTNKILITERSPNLRTYPNSWVLPGGHLDPNETIFEGGLRECSEQVGLPPGSQIEPVKQNMVMLWESVFTADNQVKACAIVVFFVVLCDDFHVKVQDSEVSQFRWKHIQDRQGEVRYSLEKRQGYAEGHLKFLEVVRAHLLKSGTKL